MRLGWFTVPEDAPAGAADRILAQLAGSLAAEGFAVAGAVQRNIDRGADCDCDMEVLVLGEEDRPVRISQTLGPGSTGCRLDAGALEQAAQRAGARMAGAQVLIVPKFGRQEAVGRGFRDVIAEAIAQDLPVLLYVPPEQLAAFEAFSDGLAERIDTHAAASWCRAAAGRR